MEIRIPEYKYLIIIPCYNEADRLDLKEFSSQSKDIYYLFVDDGSKDETSKKVSEFLSDNICLLTLEKNMGKAGAVREGFLYSKTLDFYNDINWIGYWDADLATSLSEVHDFTKFAHIQPKFPDAIFGSRVSKLGSSIKRSYRRHLLGRAFATAAYLMLKIDSYDSQCGAKLFKREIIDSVFDKPFISKWLFDIEILLRLNSKKLNTIEYPLLSWEDIDGSKCKPTRELFRTISDLRKIRKEYILR